MSREQVYLASTGKYWAAYFYDSQDRRRKKTLGPKDSLSKRQAETLTQRLAVQLSTQPGMRDTGRVPTLEAWLKSFLTERTGLTARHNANLDLAGRYLLQFFGPHRRLDKITPADAAAWRAALAAGTLQKAKKSTQRTMASEASVANNTRAVKTIFNAAADRELIQRNPFAKLKSTAPKPEPNWRYVTREEFEKVLDSCPNVDWRAFVALQRYAGLRRGEAATLRWEHVDLAKSRLKIFANKTKSTRVVPIEPRLREILEQTRDDQPKNEPLVVREARVDRKNLGRDWPQIIRAAEIEPWKDPFQVLRRNCETDWAQTYPQYVVSKWIGHDIRVSADFYLQVPEELYAKVSSASSTSKGASSQLAGSSATDGA